MAIRASDVKIGMKVGWKDEDGGYWCYGTVTKYYCYENHVEIYFNGCAEYAYFGLLYEFELLSYELPEPQGTGSLVVDSWNALWCKDSNGVWLDLQGGPSASWEDLEVEEVRYDASK